MSELRPHEILLVEDDEVIREATAESLRRDGFEVRMAGTGPDGLAALPEREPSLAILDVMLPGFGGVELCREIRRDSQVPIVSSPPAPTRSTSCSASRRAPTTTSRSRSSRPCWPPACGPRCAAPGRRRCRTAASTAWAPSAIDRAGHVVTKDAEAIALTPTEYRLLAELMDNPGVALDRAALLERVWGYGWAGDSRLVDVHIQRLRAKIEDDPTNPELVLTVRGVGYKLARV